MNHSPEMTAAILAAKSAGAFLKNILRPEEGG